MSIYEPGTVAVATVRGVPNVRVFRGEGFWRTAVECGGNVTHHDFNDGVTDVRPLVVLDPGDLPNLRAYLPELPRDWDDDDHRLSALAEQIEQQTIRPEPTEGTIARITGKTRKSASVIFAEWTNGEWRHAGGERVNFGPGGIEVLEVVRPGIEEES